ncbi:MAG TPA: hypothetical protein VGX70_10600 [Gemmataceae bacterium]|jgi:hypothetical protein|nr:hypothetical protein [Gemmataceae bacterium]
MNSSRTIQAAAIFLFMAGAVNADTPRAAPNSARKALAVWDTTQSSEKPYTSKSITDQTGWTQISAQDKPSQFQGDAVISNGRVLGVIRKQSSGMEVYSEGASGAVRRLELQLVSSAGELAERLERVAVVENSKAAVCLEASFKTAKGEAVTAKYRLKRGDVSIQVDPGPMAGRLKVECPCRFAVLPDFFADDMVIDARAIPPNTAELASDNFVLHLAGNGAAGSGDAIGMCVFENRKQDVSITLSGAGEQRTIMASEIPFEGKKVWVAVLEAPRIWHNRDLKTSDTGEIVALDWKMPFPAQWRCDFTKTTGLTDSWEMLLQNPNGDGYLKPSWLGSEEDHLGSDRKRWNTVLGRYPYPCWCNKDGRGYLQPLESKALQFQGPVVAYPINRVKETPLDAYTVVDVMRNTLGVGPCQYILDLEGQKSEYRGRATCSVRDELGAIYEKNRQKEERERVDKILDEGLTFVKHIRGRITRYVDFGHQMRDYLAAEAKAHPELADVVKELDQIVSEIDKRVAARQDKIQTPAHVAAMNEEFRKNVRDDYGPDALAKCKQYTQDLVVIGDNQDELSGECRWVVKSLRQKAGLLLAQEPKAAAIATEVRARTQEALRFPANHEGAHH